ncbi:MAG: hypothetical protein R6V72_19735 [Cyclobacterium sp.]|uniref:hypothetical protein n=1 Tax=Cyclobacterium sp. TaxID=1966343 RepID=UPI003970BEFA
MYAFGINAGISLEIGVDRPLKVACWRAFSVYSFENIKGEVTNLAQPMLPLAFLEPFALRTWLKNKKVSPNPEET